MSKKTYFLKQFWQEKKMVGSMIPSSRYLAKKMLQNVNFKKARVLVELGPGTGVFTRKILEQMHEDAKLFVFELNDQFYQNLQEEIQDDRLVLIHDSAEHIQKYLNDAGFIHADYVISSLPLTNFPKKLKESILKTVHHCLKNEGCYIQFAYSLISKKVLETQFDEMDISFTPLNFPPAFIYTCSKTKN